MRERLKVDGPFTPFKGGDHWVKLHPYEYEKLTDALRFRIDSVKELSTQASERMFADYVSFLNDPKNRRHFSDPPTTSEELRELCQQRGLHPLIALNIFGEVVGGATIRDAAPNQHDHFLELFVINPNLQLRGAGKELLDQVLDWAAQTKAVDKFGQLTRVRYKLDASIIGEVEGWEKMQSILDKTGFYFISRLPEEVDIPKLTREGRMILDEKGQLITERKPTLRWEIKLDEWRKKRDLQTII